MNMARQRTVNLLIALTKKYEAKKELTRRKAHEINLELSGLFRSLKKLEISDNNFVEQIENLHGYINSSCILAGDRLSYAMNEVVTFQNCIAYLKNDSSQIKATISMLSRKQQTILKELERLDNIIGGFRKRVSDLLVLDMLSRQQSEDQEVMDTSICKMYFNFLSVGV